MHPDSGKSSGFFGKVMHLMRGKAGAETPSDAEGLGASEESSQEVLARKRRNDAIRRQEFAQLRQLRQGNGSPEGAQLALAVKDEPLQSVYGQETRSLETLQKIDAIEAQISGQWWQKQSAQAVAQEPSPVSPSTSAAVPSAEASAAADLVPQPELAASVTEVPAAIMQPPAPSFVLHPDVEEAAILFAHGDMDGARTRLLEQLVQSLSAAPVDEDKVAVLWHAVLDLCRATGDEETFEPLAIDYAEHFGRSAPLWVSIPERLGMPPLCGSARQQTTSKRKFHWSAPSVVTVAGVTALRVAKEEAPQPWFMSWVRLNKIEEAALTPLTNLLQEWADKDGQFVFSDAGKLLQLLEQHTPVSDATCSAQWWALRMVVLRLMARMEAYEQVALDYCITYEVSPPSWIEPRCHCVAQEEGEADVSLLQEASSVHAGTGAAGAAMPVVIDRSQGLAGVIEGDLQEWLDVLGAKAQNSKTLDVACDKLIRMDFVAAGTVLNWAADLQRQGVGVRFTQLHQLMAAFFHVIGIQEHAVVQATQA